MAVQLREGVVAMCDSGNEIAHCGGQANTVAELADGKIAIELPHGWSRQSDGKLLCEACTGHVIEQKLREMPLPDPKDDPPVVVEHREAVRELENALAEGVPVEETPIGKIVFSGSDPDFVMTPSEGERIEVRLLPTCNRVEILDRRSGVTVELRHDEHYNLLDSPPLFDSQLLGWIQSCLRTVPQITDEEDDG